jgi:hypothetical protein
MNESELKINESESGTKYTIYKASTNNDFIYIIGETEFIKINMNTTKIAKKIPLNELYDKIGANFSITKLESCILSDDNNSLFMINKRNEIARVNLKTFGVTHLNFKVSMYAEVTKISDDANMLVTFCESRFGAPEITYHYRELYMFKYDSYFDYYINEDYAIYLAFLKRNNKNMLVKRNIITGKQIRTEIPELISVDYLKPYVFIHSPNKTTCYSMEDLKQLYEVPRCYNFTNKYIMNIVSGKDPNHIRIYSTEDGKLISEFSTINMYTANFMGNLIAAFKPLGSPGIRVVFYNIYGKKLGCSNSDCIYRNTIRISSNGQYIYMNKKEEITSTSLTDLYNDDRKLEFLKGKDSPDSSIGRAATDPLFDEHLFGEIFQFLGNEIFIS